MITINCPYSGKLTHNYAVRGVHRTSQIHHIVAMDKRTLDNLAATEQQQTAQFLILCGYLRIAQAIFSAPLTMESLDEFTLAALIPRASAAASKLSGPMALAYPRLHITGESTGADLSAWLEAVESINSTKRVNPEESETQRLIEFIWQSPAMKAGTEWLRKSLANATICFEDSMGKETRRLIEQFQIDEVCKVCSRPQSYEPAAIKAVSQLLLKCIFPASEQDSLNLQRILDKLAKARYAKLSFDAMLNDPDFALADELEAELSESSFANEDSLKAAIKTIRATPVAQKRLESEPVRIQFATGFAYNMAMIIWRTQNAVK